MSCKGINSKRLDKTTKIRKILRFIQKERHHKKVFTILHIQCIINDVGLHFVLKILKSLQYYIYCKNKIKEGS